MRTTWKHGGERMDVQVQCYSGYKVNERPMRFTLDGRTFLVQEILDQWYGEDYRYFKLRADDGHIYILKYQETRDHWSLEMFQRAP